MSKKKSAKGTPNIKEMKSKPIQVTVIYGNKDLADCMKSVMRIHNNK